MNDREKLYIIGGIIVLVLFAGFNFIILPMQHSYAEKQVYIEKLYSDMKLLNHLGSRYNQIKANKPVGSLSTLLDRLLHSSGLDFKVKDNNDDKSLEVHIDGASIEDIRQILYHIEKADYLITAFELGGSFTKEQLLVFDMTILKGGKSA